MNSEKNRGRERHNAALPRTAQAIFDELRQLNSLRTRLIWGVLIATIYLASVLIDMRDFGSGFLPDTAGYLQFSPYRQPMYGIWANAIYAFSGSWHIVQVSQIAAFVLCSAWVIVELAVISQLGIISALSLCCHAIGIDPIGATKSCRVPDL